MLTAERFSGRYASYWGTVLPQLEHFVRLANLGPKRLAPALSVTFAAERQALVSETAFMLWAYRNRGGEVFRDALAAAQTRLAELVPGEYLSGPLSEPERRLAHAMARRTTQYLADDLNLSDVEVEPRLPGCGTVSGGVPDVLGSRTSQGRSLRFIVEIKAVDRTFRSTDFRQLVTYAVLIFAAREQIPDAFALMNPLRGTAVEIGLSAFFDDTARAPADQLLQRLLAEWSDPQLSG